MAQNSDENLIEHANEADDDSDTDYKTETESSIDSSLSETEFDRESELGDTVCENLYQNRHSTGDVKIIINQHEPVRCYFDAHKLILGAGSPKFHEIFYGSSRPTNEVEITDCDPVAFNTFLKCFYMKNVQMNRNNVYGVLELAKKYQVPQCLEVCFNVLINEGLPYDIFPSYKEAIQQNQSAMKRVYEAYISDNAADIFGLDLLLEMDHGLLKRILQLNRNCDETLVFNTCLLWAKRRIMDPNPNGKELKEKLGDCLHFIRFDRMTVRQVLEYNAKHDGLFSIAELEDIIHSITDEQYQSTLFRQ